MKIVYILALLVAVFLISGCIEGLSELIGPDWTIKAFYSDLNHGNFESAARKTTIYVDKNPLDDIQKNVFVGAAKLIFGNNGERINLGSAVIQEKTELNPEQFEGDYNGNITKAYDVSVKVPVVGKINSQNVHGSIIANIFVDNTVLLINGNWYISDWNLNLFNGK